MASKQKQQKWEQRYQGKTEIPEPCYLLQSQANLLPDKGVALDLACGLGGNAVFLAKHGLNTVAWDFAENPIKNLNHYAQTQNLPLRGEVRDVCADPPVSSSFNVIVVSHFLDRDLCPLLVSALKANGLLFYQTFARDRFDPSIGPQNLEFLLADDELLMLFAGLKTQFYLVGRDQQQLPAILRNQHFYIGRKI